MIITKSFLSDIIAISKTKVESDALEEILKNQEDASLRCPGVEAHYYRFLYKLCRAIQPSLSIELGTHTGISAACMAEGWSKGKVITINNNSELREDCRRSNVTYLIQDSLIELDLKERADILFIDTDHNGTRPIEEYRMHVKHVKPGGVVFFDDIFLLDCMKGFWKNFDPKEGIKMELPAHGWAGFGAVLITEAQEA